MRRWTSARVVARGCAVLLAITIVGFTPRPAHAVTGTAKATAADRSVPVTALTHKESVPRRPAAWRAAPVVWPVAATAEIDVEGSSPALRAGGLSVAVHPRAAPDDSPDRSAAGRAGSPRLVRLEVVGHDAASRTGVPAAVRLRRIDGQAAPGRVRIELNYTGFADAYGAGWSQRLRMVSLPGCALTTPELAACRLATPLNSRNTAGANTVSAEVLVPGTSEVVVALTAGSASATGDFSRTQLSQSSSWTAGGSSGGFTWSYPIAAPPVPGNLTPSVSLDYSSAAVDGQTANNNTQPGWIGEGFSYEPGYIERSYRPCDQDTAPVAPYWPTTATMKDLCWRLPNAHLVWNGKSTELIPEHGSLGAPNTFTPTTWHLADDDGTKVEYISDNGTGRTGYWRNERWKLTTKDGTQFFFGLSYLPSPNSTPVPTGSVLGEAIMGNHAGEPCFSSAAVTSSWCRIAYRWNLDYVVDAHGNAMAYYYNRESNGQEIFGSPASFVYYYRASTLSRIDYGLRAGSTAPAPARIVFTTSNRCWTTTCATHDASNWPDVPWDLDCTGQPCPPPSYWTTQRLTRIETQVNTGGTSYRAVDRYDLDSTVPGTNHAGQGGVLALFHLDRTGMDTGNGVSGGAVAMPRVSLNYGESMQNRALFAPGSGAAESWKYRLQQIDTDTGKRITVSYTQDADCVYPAPAPNPDFNTQACFPQEYQGAWTWWHKYVVGSVLEHDDTGASPDVNHAYTYDIALPGLRVGGGSIGSNTGVLWHHDMGAWGTEMSHRGWSQWSGFPLVTESTGSGPVISKTTRLYFRGLDGDRTDAGDGTRQVTITDTDHGAASDAPFRAGQLKETLSFDRTALVRKDFVDPVQLQTGSRTLDGTWALSAPVQAWWTGTGWTKRMDWLAGSSAWRTSQTLNTFDLDPSDGSYGSLVRESRLGDLATTADDACTTNTYNLNTRVNLVRFLGGAAVVVGAPIADWTDFDRTFSPGDFTGDGKPDLGAVRRSDGTLWIFRGDGAGGYDAGTQVATGFNQYSIVLSPGDFTRDGHPDVLARRSSDGTLWLYRGDGAGGFSGAATQAGTGTGWNAYEQLFSPGDFSANGVGDVIGMLPDGTLHLYSGNGSGGWTNSNAIVISGVNLVDYTVFGYGDYSGDTTPDILAAGPGGLWVYPGLGNGLVGSRAPLAGFGAAGSNTGGYVAVGDINGDGTKDILTRTAGYRADTVQEADTYGQACTVTPTYPADAVSAKRYFYDQPGAGSPALAARPWAGDVTRIDAADTYAGSTPNWVTQSQSVFDVWGRPTSVKDPLGKATLTGYTQTNGLTSQRQVTNPLGHQVTTTLAVGRGLSVTVTDANGKTTTGGYDALGRLAKVWQPGHPVTGVADAEYAYVLVTSGGLVTSVYLTTKVLGPNANQITSYQFLDGFLRTRQNQTPTASGGRSIVDTQYDSRGLAVKVSTYANSSPPGASLVSAADTAIGEQHRYTFDGLGRPLTDELWSLDVKQWNVSTTSYDGDRTTVDAPPGGTHTTTIHDAFDRPTELWQYQGSAHDTTSYRYDHAGQLAQVTGPDGEHWTYTYDLLGRKKSTVDPDAGSVIVGYDDAGRVVSTTDGRGQVLAYTYDDLGRKTGAYKNSVAAGNQLAGWDYDTVAKGQLTSSTRYAGGSAYTRTVTAYDDGYRPLHTDLTVPAAEGALAGTYSSDYSYRANGAPATVTAAATGGLPAETLTYTYNSVGQPIGLSGAQAYLADTAYTFDGLTAQRIMGVAGKQVRQTYGYEPSSRRLLSAQLDTENQATPGTWVDATTDTYAYDQAGNVQSLSGKTAGVADVAECYDYDDLRRLTAAWTEVSAACDSAAKHRTGADPYHLEWAYNTAGNRTSEASYNADNTVEYSSTYTYGGVGRGPHAVATVTTTGLGAGTNTYTYDPAGNTIGRSGQTLTWDAEGHLATDAGSTFTYDADGTRLLRQDPGGFTTLTLPDGTELRANGSGSVAGTRYYNGVAVRAANTDAAGNLVGGTTLTWTVADHHGTGTVVVNSTTLQTDHRRSLPFGGARGTQPSGFGTKGFVGGTADPTGLTHLGAREYDPSIGRFTSVDPIFDQSDPQSWNGYAYANNAPTTGSDPTGTITCGDDIDMCKNYDNGGGPGSGGGNNNNGGSKSSSGHSNGGSGSTTCHGSEHSGGCGSDGGGTPPAVCHGSEHSGGCGSASTQNTPTCDSQIATGAAGSCPAVMVPTEVEHPHHELSLWQTITIRGVSLVLHTGIQAACVGLLSYSTAGLGLVASGAICGAVAGAVADGAKYLLTASFTGEKFNGGEFLKEVFFGALRGAATGAVFGAIADQLLRVLQTSAILAPYLTNAEPALPTEVSTEGAEAAFNATTTMIGP